MVNRWQPPNLDTRFHIDMEWWENSGRDIRVYIRDLLCDDCREHYADNFQELEKIDWVDELTGEVSVVDGLWHCLRTCCSQKPGYIGETTPIVDAVFRTLLANGNKPMSVRELHAALDRRPARTLLRILTGGQVYMGIRPYRD